jgi:hypothetical protein
MQSWSRILHELMAQHVRAPRLLYTVTDDDTVGRKVADD